MNAQAISEATNCPTAHHAESKVNVHCQGSEPKTRGKIRQTDKPGETVGCFQDTAHLMEKFELESSYRMEGRTGKLWEKCDINIEGIKKKF